MLDIIKRFVEQEREYEEKRDAIDRKILERQSQAERLQKRLEKLPRTNWIKGIVEPLAASLAASTGLSWEIYGPFGLQAETSIYLREDMSRGICDQTTRSITLVPKHGPDGGWLIHYQTGETDNHYPKGSLGELNNMNKKTAPLPDTIEAIEKLLEIHIHEEGDHEN